MNGVSWDDGVILSIVSIVMSRLLQTYLVSSQLGKKFGVVRKRLDLYSDTFSVNSKKLSSIRREGNFLDLISIYKPEEIRVSDIDRSSSARLNDGEVLGC